MRQEKSGSNRKETVQGLGFNIAEPPFDTHRATLIINRAWLINTRFKYKVRFVRCWQVS